MSTAHDSLSNVLFGQIRGGVLALLYGRTDESFYVRQIARHLEASVGAVQRELEKLAQIRLITRRSSGNQVFYHVNQQSPVFADMRSLVNKTVGVFNIVHNALEPLAERILVAFVYGSVAREEETAQSDLDLMIVGDVELDEILSDLTKVEVALGRPVNPTVYSAKEFKQKIASGNHFVNAVMKGKRVFLMGSENELRKVGGIRMAKTRSQQPK
ncbi:MAG TPA: nucleotidyltransferase domain-containing protein [Candidatus Angelobacter sp.]|jgi:predicted nucleotidyltransferase|nr:nucleotidyltransferase domain-containing protein [Candidatus Angelobacter sp.]